MSQRRPPFLLRFIRARARLFGAAAVGAAVTLALTAEFRLATRLLLGWDIAVALYLLITGQMMARATVHEIRRRAAATDEGRVAILVLTVSAAAASFGAIIAELGSGRPEAAAVHQYQLILATLTILLSWFFTHTIFALHYAHEFYSEDGERAEGLIFPGGEEPDYFDFVYFSFVIGMTSQVSDVAVSTKPIRRTVAAHGILSFIFNAAILALTVNIAASVI